MLSIWVCSSSDISCEHEANTSTLTHTASTNEKPPLRPTPSTKARRTDSNLATVSTAAARFSMFVMASCPVPPSKDENCSLAELDALSSNTSFWWGETSHKHKRVRQASRLGTMRAARTFSMPSSLVMQTSPKSFWLSSGGDGFMACKSLQLPDWQLHYTALPLSTRLDSTRLDWTRLDSTRCWCTNLVSAPNVLKSITKM